MNPVEEIKTKAEEIQREVKPWIEHLARLGLAARGFVYLVLGLLTLKAARGLGSAEIDQDKAFLEIFLQPFGGVVLVIIAVGLTGYALWQLVLAVEDPEGAGANLKGLLRRASYTVGSLAHAGLALTAGRRVLGFSSSGSEETARDVTASLLALPFGQGVIVLAGLVVAGVGLVHFYRVFKADFERQLRAGAMSMTWKKWAVSLGRLGHAALGLVYCLIGFFLVQAALEYDPDKAGGLGEALQALASQPNGAWVLGGIAAGMIAYGVFALILARYRKIYLG